MIERVYLDSWWGGFAPDCVYNLRQLTRFRISGFVDFRLLSVFLSTRRLFQEEAPAVISELLKL
jgi:hypothetical protein